MKCEICEKEFDDHYALTVCEHCGVLGCNDKGAEDGDGCLGDTSGAWDCPKCGKMNNA